MKSFCICFSAYMPATIRHIKQTEDLCFSVFFSWGLMLSKVKHKQRRMLYQHNKGFVCELGHRFSQCQENQDRTSDIVCSVPFWEQEIVCIGSCSRSWNCSVWFREWCCLGRACRGQGIFTGSLWIHSTIICSILTRAQLDFIIGSWQVKDHLMSDHSELTFMFSHAAPRKVQGCGSKSSC